MPLASLDRVSVAFGHLPLFAEATLQIEAGERIALIGRNGSGKSTLLRVLSGEQAPDAGAVSVQPGVRIGRLEQDVPLSASRAVFDVVADGLGDLSGLVAAFHHAAVQVTDAATPAALAELGRLQHELERHDGWRLEQRVELVLSRLQLPSETIVHWLATPPLKFSIVPFCSSSVPVFGGTTCNALAQLPPQLPHSATASIGVGD